MKTKEQKQTILSCERKGRKLMENLLTNYDQSEYISNIRRTKTSDRLDMYCLFNCYTTIGFEIKVRSSEYFFKDTILIEKSKYDELMLQLNNNNIMLGYYCNFYEIDSPFGSDTFCYMYEARTIGKYINNSNKIYCKDSTVLFNDYVDKECILLPKSEAIVYKFDKNTNFWNNN